VVAVILAAAIALSSSCLERPETRFVRTFEEGRSALREGQLARARELSVQALDDLASQPESVWAWRFRLLGAEADIAGADRSRAVPALDSTIPPGDRFASLRARQKYLQARLLLLRGNLQGTLDALEAATALAPADSELRRDAGVLAGQVRMRLGRWSEAESSLNALVAETSASGDGYRQALALNNLGMGYLVRNRFDEALLRLEKITELPGIDRTTVYAAALNNAGICYARLGEFDRAVAAQRRAVSLHEKTGRRVEFEQALGELGSTYLLQEDFDRGLPYLQQALTISTGAGFEADAALWARNLAAAYVGLGKWDEAEKYNREARRLNPSDRPAKLAFSTLHEGHIAAGRGKDTDASKLFGEALAASKSEPAVQWSAHDGLAKVAMKAGQPAEAARHFEAALNIIETTRSDLLKTDYKLSFLARLIHFYDDYVNALVDAGRVARALEVADSSRGRVLAERQDVAAPTSARAPDFLRIARESGAVLLFYWLGNPRSHLFVVSSKGIDRFDLPAATEIEALVGQYDDALQRSPAGGLDAHGRAIGDRLFASLVNPARPFIPLNGAVIVVPDGALHALNFETLPVPGGSRRFWIEDVEVQVAPSLGLLRSAGRVDSGLRPLLLIGNPTPHEPDFPALSYAPVEMAAIAKHFPPGAVTTFQGAAASPGAFVAARPDQFQMIHFAAHAEANPGIPLDSAVILSGPDLGFKLYAREVAAAPLRAELVTVSACRSAGNHAYAGEGLVGLAWAFMRAGARRVVAGLWDVDDQSTAELMGRFYGSLAAGDSPSRAFRQAKLWMMSRGGNYVKPYYWGAFEVFTVSTSR
jgi:tetratricopeptide (TPR) repeat protein